MISIWKRTYGESPLHLLGQLIALTVAVYAFTHIVDLSSTDRFSLLVWFVAGAVLHDLVFVPIYLILDLLMRLVVQDHPLLTVRVVNHIRVPAVISGVLLLTTFSLILGKNQGPFMRAAGVHPPDYLGRWLIITAVLFAVSAAAYIVRVRLDATRRARPADTTAAAAVRT